MDSAPLSATIIKAFDSLPAQLKLAARYVLDHPHDVALLSMREQARRANVTPATMTRLAQQLGLEGYDALKSAYAEAVRDGAISFTRRAGAQVEHQKLKGDSALAAELLGSGAQHIAQMTTPETFARLAAAARDLGAARRIYCLGLRSSHAVAWHFAYILSLFSESGVLLDGMGGTSIDRIRHATSQDALVAVSVAPYTRATLEIAEYAAARDVPLIAVTDSEVSPLAQIARHKLIVPIESPSFFHTMAPAFTLAETLAVLVAGRGGEAALEALRKTDAQMAEFNTHSHQFPRFSPS
ncbi:transcriptional regulator [Defluviimonas sp. 20V17]|uniref:Transcriptional regulator n=1 Tax=Allgaiera indica TaxID=765699 RepID=A0AAN4USN6_9RHOB|nr:MurR/RpiR family transcriptional regulator [Allgaiera indica]KDB02036.1 transcriptional regulator [Defluviimonas sp. 20V17]GHE03070.1 transcriptional regulator [Allgaiera indica]SDX11955.1 transcriptional regulator, RpiR family [Allgaiera indica]